MAERLVDEQAGVAIFALVLGRCLGFCLGSCISEFSPARSAHQQSDNAGREAVRMAERLVDEQAGVAIFALGVGRGVEKTELDRIIGVCGQDLAPSRYMPLCTIDEAPW